MTKIKQWLTLATSHEQQLLAKESNTTQTYLYQLSVGIRTASADMAGRIEDAAKNLRKLSKGRLPKITRADLCPACAECPYAKKCAKE